MGSSIVGDEPTATGVWIPTGEGVGHPHPSTGIHAQVKAGVRVSMVVSTGYPRRSGFIRESPRNVDGAWTGCGWGVDGVVDPSDLRVDGVDGRGCLPAPRGRQSETPRRPVAPPSEPQRIAPQRQ